MTLRVLPERARGVCCPPRIQLQPERADHLADTLKALGDPTRLQMVSALARAKDPVCICDFTAAFNLSQPTISHHMGKLRDAGLVDCTRKGIWAYYRLRPNLDVKTRSLIDALI